MEQKKDVLENGIQTCVEIMMLAGVGACFFVVLRRSKAVPFGLVICGLAGLA
jgi:hypothetical protein